MTRRECRALSWMVIIGHLVAMPFSAGADIGPLWSWVPTDVERVVRIRTGEIDEGAI